MRSDSCAAKCTTRKVLYTLLPFLAALLIVPGRGTAQPSVPPDTAALWVGTRFNGNLAKPDEPLPFWLQANRNGLYDPASANGLFRIWFTQPVYHHQGLSIVSEGAVAARTAGDPWTGFPTLSVTARYRGLQFRAGRFVDPIGTHYRPLSSGSMLYGTNTLPVPKLALATDGYLDVPGAAGHLQVFAYLSHGWFEASRYTQNPFLHQKQLYLKINYKQLEAVGGLVHNAQWGGTSPVYGDLPDSFGDYLRMVVGNSADTASGISGAETRNSLGNSIAGYDFNLQVKLERFRLTFYRLFYLEDKVSLQFRSPWDGMWGAGLIRTGTQEDRPFLKALLYEHINTKRQDSFDFEPRGSASYYNHSVYRSGWSYRNRVLGNPLLLTDGTDDRPVYNNIVVAHHLGAKGFVGPELQWRAFYTYSRNYGEVNDQIIPGTRVPCGEVICADLYPLEMFKKVNHSLYVGGSYLPSGNASIRFEFGLAADLGALYGDRLGLEVGVSYRVY